MCINCKNCYSHKCEYIRTSKKQPFQVFNRRCLKECKNFVSDTWLKMEITKFCRLIKISTTDFYKIYKLYGDSYLVNRAKHRGYDVRISVELDCNTKLNDIYVRKINDSRL